MKVWETPFKDLFLPSIEYIDDGEDQQYLRIWTKSYKQSSYYKVVFENLAAIKIEDESLAGNCPEGCESLNIRACSFENDNSVWIKSFDALLVEHEYISLRHFIVTGGDYIIQILAHNYVVSGPHEQESKI